MLVQCTCTHCGTAYWRSKYRPGRFCTYRCGALARSPRLTLTCVVCGATYVRIRSRATRTCSRRCEVEDRRKPLAERFFRYVQKAETPDGCWKWTGYKNPAGYGQINLGGRGLGAALAHRVSWELHNGPIPDGFEVCHRDDRPECVAPHHLFLGRHVDNMADAAVKLRTRGGHPKLTPDAVRAIRAQYAAGATQAALANEHAVTTGAICGVLSGKNWKHVV